MRADGFLHLPDAHSRPQRKLPAVLTVFGFEPARPDAKGEAAAADLVDAGGNLRQVGRIAIVDGRDERREADALGHGGQAGQNGPALHEGFIRSAHIGDLDEVIHHREPGEAVVLGPLGLGLHGLENLRRVGTEQPGRIVNAKLHASLPRPIASRTDSQAIPPPSRSRRSWFRDIPGSLPCRFRGRIPSASCRQTASCS